MQRDLMLQSINIFTVSAIILGLLALSFLFTRGRKIKPQEKPDFSQLKSIIGAKVIKHENHYSVAFPYPELAIEVDGFTLRPAMELEFESLFFPMNSHTMLMAEIAVLESEILAIEKIIIDHNLTITALHNHFIRDVPKIMFIHIQGMGELANLVRAVKTIQDKITALRAENNPTKGNIISKSSLNTDQIDTIMDLSGKLEQDGVYKIKINRPSLIISDQNMPIGSDSWITFQGISNKAAIAGEFALNVPEVAPFIDALIKNGIEVVAVHNHMTTEQPRIIFVHTWAVGHIEDIAKAMRAALNIILS